MIAVLRTLPRALSLVCCARGKPWRRRRARRMLPSVRGSSMIRIVMSSGGASYGRLEPKGRSP
jgi:hypothetical protein